jgi:hypothetical protein
MRVVFLLFSFLIFLSLATAASAQSIERQSFNVTTVKKPGGITQFFAKRPWDGLFSAKKFGRSDAVELQNIQANLQASLLDLPTAHTNALKKLEVRKDKHVSRGLANSRMMILNTDSIANNQELQAVFTHEMGHIVDLGMLTTNSYTRTHFWTAGTQVFANDPSLDFYHLSWLDYNSKSLLAKRADFVSGYAMTSPFEDFAESYLFYRLHGEKFRKISNYSNVLAAKYLFMKNEVFNDEEFQVAKKENGFLHNLIWDATLVKF